MALGAGGTWRGPPQGATRRQAADANPGPGVPPQAIGRLRRTSLGGDGAAATRRAHR